MPVDVIVINLLQKYILPKWLERLISSPYLVAIREGLTLTMPIILAGTIAILINSFPWSAYQNYMLSVFGEEWKLFGGYIYNGTFSIMSLLMVLSIGHSLAENYNAENPLDRVSPAILAIVTLSCVIAMMEPIHKGAALSIRWLGVHGLLLSIITAVLACFLFRFLLKFQFLRITFHAGSTGNSMTQAMMTIFPGVLTIIFFATIKAVTKIYGIEDLNEAIYQLLSAPFREMGGNYLQTAIIHGFVRHFLWFLGIHGSNVLEPIMQELYIPAIQANIENYQAGLPPYVIFTKPFFDAYISIGGAGSTFGLLIACLWRHKDNGIKKIAKISLIPSIFNINELLLFGLPVVLNPVFLLPFILTPIITTITAYYANLWGIVPLTVHDVAWNIPLLINGYLATESIWGSLLQLFNIAISVAIYLPFVILDDRLKTTQFNDSFRKLVNKAIDGVATDSGPRLLNCPSPVGPLAYNLATDMKTALSRNEFYMEYQPQVDSDTGKVYGVESLMRWNHIEIGRIPPPVFITLAEDTGYIIPLGLFALEESIRQQAEWRAAGLTDLIMSVNVSAKQLEDPHLPDQVMEMLTRHNVPVEYIKLEVTESIALTSQMVKNQVLARLHTLNIQLAIDDFGMGHSSLTYLKKFPVGSLKVDGILSRDVLHSRSSCEIISSIAELCHSLNINLVAEYVDNEAQLIKLRSLGCNNIQGYFYSAPLSAEATFAFVSTTHKAYGIYVPEQFQEE